MPTNFAAALIGNRLSRLFARFGRHSAHISGTKKARAGGGIAESPPATAIRLQELCTLILALVWASFPALFFDAASINLRILAVAVIFAISAIAAFALARVKPSTVLFCALIAGSLALASSRLGGEMGLALGIYSLLYSIAVALMISRACRTENQRRAVESVAGKQQEFVSLLLNDAGAGAGNWLWETGGDGKLTYVSRGLCAGLGKSPSELIGKTLAMAVGASPEDRGWSEFSEHQQARRSIDGCRLSIRFDARETWWRITAKPLEAAGGSFAGYRGAARDVTEDYVIGSNLVEAKEAAERASATKSQFLAVMSHELRTPLNAIVGFAELLGSAQSDNMAESTRADHLRIIIESSRHLQALINDILDVTRIEKGSLQLVEQEADVAELVEVAAKMCRDLAEKANITIIAHIVEGVEVKVDITRIKQVLINLIANAVKFSSPGGYVNVGFESSGKRGLAIVVRDGGIGIRKQDLQRIFEPFVQVEGITARQFGGIGLGLAIANKIALLHGGNITIESEFGVGTTARLILPPARIAWPGDRNAKSANAA